MSFGGVLGGLFASPVAPQVFNQIFEYPILLVVVFFCRCDVMAALGRRDRRAIWPVAMLAVGVAGLAVYRMFGDVDPRFLAMVPLLPEQLR